jgi:hypothetical protein
MVFDLCWKGEERCFVIGGGPSLKGFDWKLLEGERVIGSNFSHPAPAISVVNDVRIIRTPETAARWQAMDGEKVFVCRQVVEPGEASYAQHVPVIEEWSTSLERGLLACNKCGLTAINLADLIGVATIYLLGFDLSAINGRTAHWHDIYPKDWGTDGRAYINMLRAFGKWAEYCKTKVINLNPDSALECFEKADPASVL